MIAASSDQLSIVRTRCTTPIAWLIVSACCVTAPADVSAQAREKSVELDSLEEVIVTAQKRRERLQDVPVSISVLGGSELETSSFAGAMEALTTVPGVALLPGSGVGTGAMVNIRGISAAGNIFNGSSPIGYYLDGVAFGMIRDAFTPDQSAFDLERIEVLRGPQGTLYGASAANGLVRVLTRPANLDEFEIKARSTVSQTDDATDMNYRADAAINVPIVPDVVAARAVVGYEKYAGWIDSVVPGNFRKDLNDAVQRTFRLRVDSKPSEQLSVGVSSWVSRKDADNSNTSTDRRRTAAAEQPSVEDFDAHSVVIGYEAPSFSVASTSAYMRYKTAAEIDTRNLFGIVTNAAGEQVGPLQSWFDTQAYSQEIIANDTGSSPWIWTVGGMYRDLEESLVQEWRNFSPRLHYIERSKSWAVFGQVGRRLLNDRFEWVVGVRSFQDRIEHDQAAETVSPGTTRFEDAGKYDAVTPTAKLTWKPSDDKMFYASYAQGFRSGLPLAYTIALQAPGFPDAKPDKLHSYELGDKLSFWGGALSIESAVFYIKWDDVQQTVSVPFGCCSAVGAPINGESASGIGADLSFTVRPNSALEFGVSGGWNDITMDRDVRVGLQQNLQFLKGDRLNSSPQKTAYGFIDYQFPLTDSLSGKVSLSLAYVSEVESHGEGTQTAPNVAVSDDYRVVRGQVAIMARRGWELSIFGDNLTDESGSVSPAGPVGDPDLRQRLRPRTIGVQLTAHL